MSLAWNALGKKKPQSGLQRRDVVTGRNLPRPAPLSQSYQHDKHLHGRGRVGDIGPVVNRLHGTKLRAGSANRMILSKVDGMAHESGRTFRSSWTQSFRLKAGSKGGAGGALHRPGEFRSAFAASASAVSSVGMLRARRGRWLVREALRSPVVGSDLGRSPKCWRRTHCSFSGWSRRSILPFCCGQSASYPAHEAVLATTRVPTAI